MRNTSPVTLYATLFTCKEKYCKSNRSTVTLHRIPFTYHSIQVWLYSELLVLFFIPVAHCMEQVLLMIKLFAHDREQVALNKLPVTLYIEHLSEQQSPVTFYRNKHTRQWFVRPRSPTC